MPSSRSCATSRRNSAGAETLGRSASPSLRSASCGASLTRLIRGQDLPRPASAAVRLLPVRHCLVRPAALADLSPSIDLAPMAGAYNQHNQLVVVDLIEDAIVADADAPDAYRAPASDQRDANRAWILCKSTYGGPDSELDRRRQPFKLSLGGRSNPQSICGWHVTLSSQRDQARPRPAPTGWHWPSRTDR